MTLIVLLFLAVLLAGCGRSPAPPEAQPPAVAPAPVRPATLPLPPLPEPPSVVWQTDFADLAGWEYLGPELPAEGTGFAPILAPEQSCSLTLRERLALEPRRHYRLRLELRLTPYCRRRLTAVIAQADERQTTAVLRPVRHHGWIEPPPVWVEETADLVTPGDLTGVGLRLDFEAVGANYDMPLAIRSLRIEDLGPIPMAEEPGPNLQRNPGAETVAGNEVPGWANELRLEDPDVARSGRACIRFEGDGRALEGLGGAFVSPPLIVRFRGWVKGAGTFTPECRRTGPGYLRLIALRGPDIELTDQWQEVVWEVGLPPTRPETVSFHLLADIRRQDSVYLDDIDIRILSAGGIRHN